ncbi:MAG: PaaI family thioesterase [Alphaproteobacteria bacterium]|nr:PaaI family thioesterase [Alphaproteobacteria bacterium]
MADHLEQLRDAKARHAPQDMIRAIPYLEFLGVAVREEEGDLICVLPFQGKLVGNLTLPALHGGVIGSLLESVALLQLIWTLDSATLPRTINTSLDFLRTGQAKDTYARGRITKQGRRVANVRAEAWQDDPSRPIAAAHGHFLLG